MGHTLLDKVRFVHRKLKPEKVFTSKTDGPHKAGLSTGSERDSERERESAKRTDGKMMMMWGFMSSDVGLTY